MSSQFNHFLAQSHSADLRRTADRRRPSGRSEATTEAGIPVPLRSRRLGRLLGFAPGSARPTS